MRVRSEHLKRVPVARSTRRMIASHASRSDMGICRTVTLQGRTSAAMSLIFRTSRFTPSITWKS